MRIRRYRFRTAKTHATQYKGKLLRMPKESLRGALRGNAVRERGLVPGAVKARVRRRRWVLVAAYRVRFGDDDFLAPFLDRRLPALPRHNWLSRGYAFWRGRLNSSPS